MKRAVPRHLALPRVLRRWPNSTVVILACGPSLTPEDVEFCCGKAKVICVNNTYKLAPWADALYACDSRWWFWHKGVPSFMGQKYSLDDRVRKPFPDVTVLKNTGDTGLELQPTGLRTGKNSGYQAMNLAVHLGAKKIVLLGFDMKPVQVPHPKTGKPITKNHFFGEHPHPVPPPYHLMIPKFDTIVEPLVGLGITVVNATRDTVLKAFPRATLAEALSASRSDAPASVDWVVTA